MVEGRRSYAAKEVVNYFFRTVQYHGLQAGEQRESTEKNTIINNKELTRDF